MRILLTQVTGGLGRALAQSLLASGHEVSGVALRAHRDLDPGVDFVSATPGHRVVYDLAADADVVVPLPPDGDGVRPAELVRICDAATRGGARVIFPSLSALLPARLAAGRGPRRFRLGAQPDRPDRGTRRPAGRCAGVPLGGGLAEHPGVGSGARPAHRRPDPVPGRGGGLRPHRHGRPRDLGHHQRRLGAPYPHRRRPAAQGALPRRLAGADSDPRPRLTARRLAVRVRLERHGRRRRHRPGTSGPQARPRSAPSPSQAGLPLPCNGVPRSAGTGSGQCGPRGRRSRVRRPDRSALPGLRHGAVDRRTRRAADPDVTGPARNRPAGRRPRGRAAARPSTGAGAGVGEPAGRGVRPPDLPGRLGSRRRRAAASRPGRGVGPSAAGRAAAPISSCSPWAGPKPHSAGCGRPPTR